MSEDNVTERLLDAALPHVPFDGWTDAVFRIAIEETEIDPTLAKAACPRGAVDLALAFHRRGDQAMVERINGGGFAELKIREKVTQALRIRLDVIEDREAIRRAATLFALPYYAADGARAVWQTADNVWTAIGDTSEDYNWYTKRATLSGVWGSTLLYWLGDDSPGEQNTLAFIDRRIEDVMEVEKIKGRVRSSPILGPLARGFESSLGWIKPPNPDAARNMPGQWATDNGTQAP
ncbi:MAG: COQ9 family protein [Pseudomonadota bacterium]